MALRAEERKTEIIDGILAQLGGRLPAGDAALADRFVRLFYRDVAAADLVERDPLDLYGAALALFRFGQERRPGAPKLRVYNPRLEQHGWQSVHTIVEIVNDDMPFLVDSVGMELNRHGLGVHLVIHPLVDGPARRAGAPARPRARERRRRGDARELHARRGRPAERPRPPGAARDRPLARPGRRAGRGHRLAGDARQGRRGDRRPEGRRRRACRPPSWTRPRRSCAGSPATTSPSSATAAYELEADPALGTQLRRVKGTGLGILRGYDEGGRSRSFAALPPEVRDRAREPEPPVAVAKAQARSTVHRPTYLDFIGVKRFAAGGEVVGRAPLPRPLHLGRLQLEPARDPAAAAQGRAGGRALGLHPLRARRQGARPHPRDLPARRAVPDPEPTSCSEVATEILQVQDRQKLRLFVRPDPFGRFVSCLVYVPRDRYNTAVRERMQRLLEEALHGSETEFQAQVGEAPLARLLFTVRTPDGIPADLDVEALERRLVEAAQRLERAGPGSRFWPTAARRTATGSSPPSAARCRPPTRRPSSRGSPSPTSWSSTGSPRRPSGTLGLSLYRRARGPGRPAAPQAVPPRPADPALGRAADPREHGPEGARASGRTRSAPRDGVLFLHDFELRPLGPDPVEVDDRREAFVDAFAKVWSGAAESDGFNRLVLLAGLDARAVTVLRAYCKYLLQIGSPFSQAYIEQTLASNPDLARGAGRPVRGALRPGWRPRPGARPSRPGSWPGSSGCRAWTRTASSGATSA